MNIKDMVKEYLTKHGFTGLVNLDNDNCGCELSDLFVCTEHYKLGDCKAGYKVACTVACDHDDPFEEGDWHIQEDKE